MIPDAMQRREGWTSTAANGCTAPDCGTQATDQLCGCRGRRCPEHAAHEEASCPS